MQKIILIVLFQIASASAFGQTYFDTKTKFGQAIDDNNNPVLAPYNLTPIEHSKLTDFFKRFQNDGWIEFHYPQNECQYRAHAMARILLENGIKSNKIWSFQPSLVGESGTEQLTIDDPNFIGDKVKWVYHVAPFVVVKMPNNLIDTMVIDPSMFNEPVSYKRWLGGLNTKGQYYTFMHPKYVQYHTNNQNKLDGVWYPEGYAVDMRWISTSICKGKIFYMYILNEIKPLEQRIKVLTEQLNQANSAMTQKQKDGLLIEKIQLTKIYNDRKAIATNSANFGKLPSEYQSMLIDCQEKLMECIYMYWDNIESNPVLQRCKY